LRRHRIEFTIYDVDPEDVLSVFINLERFLAMLPYITDFGVKEGRLMATFKFQRSIFTHEDTYWVRYSKSGSSAEVLFTGAKGRLSISVEAEKSLEGTNTILTVEYSGKNEWVVSTCLDEIAIIVKDYIVEMSGGRLPRALIMGEKLPRDDVVKDVFELASLILKSNLIGSIESDRTESIYNFIIKLRPLIKKATYISINRKNGKGVEFTSRLIIEDGVIVGAYVKYGDKQLTGLPALELLKEIKENAVINLWEIR